MSELTYPQVGATRSDQLPDGYRHLRYRAYLGRGVLDTAADAILTWRMHRAAGVRIRATASRAEPGVRVLCGLGAGPLRVTVPCEVVWTETGGTRAGFGYGTLPGHLARGEEAFVVDRDRDGRVWFTVTAFSRPARWYARAGGPVVVVLQYAFVRRCANALRTICAAPRTDR